MDNSLIYCASCAAMHPIGSYSQNVHMHFDGHFYRLPMCGKCEDAFFSIIPFNPKDHEHCLCVEGAHALDFSTYQIQARYTAIYPGRGKNFVYPTLGLVGEAGEVAEKVKKLIRDKGGVMDDTIRDALKKELGDVLWYIANLAAELQLSLSDIAQMNLQKLLKRQAENKLHGDGDDR